MARKKLNVNEVKENTEGNKRTNMVKNIWKKYESKCYISWCENVINVFDFHVGHDKPESKGGKLSIDNLKPICARCNLSMSNNFTITEWDKLNAPVSESTCCCCSCTVM